MTLTRSIFVGIATVLVQAAPLHAQVLEEVIVTAQKREQTLQDVALAVTALSAGKIEERGITDFSEYLRSVPSVSLQELGTLGNEVKIRGVGNGTAEVSPTTAVYLGEVPIIHTGRGVNSSYDLWTVDLERIEVLRGPQGQLWGSNSLGGAIRNVPKKPVMTEFETRGSLTMSDTHNGGTGVNADVTLNLPLVEDVFAVRLTAYGAEQAGWYDNVYSGGLPLGYLAQFAPPLLPPPAPMLPGATLPFVVFSNPETIPYQLSPNIEQDVNETDVSGARVMASWLVNDRLSADFMLAWENKETGGVSFAEDIRPVPGRIPGTFLVPNTQLPFLSVPVPSTADWKAFEFSDPVDSWHTDELTLANLVLEYDMDFATLTSSSSWWERKAERDFDFSYGLSINFTGVGDTLPGLIRQSDEPETIIQELRLASDTDQPLTWLLGLFYQDIDQDYTLWVREVSPHNIVKKTTALFLPPGTPLPDYLSLQTGSFSDEQIAVFGELTYDLTDTVNLALSARWFHLEQEAEQFFDGMGPFQVGNTERANDEDVFTPKVNLSWKPADSQHYYLTVSNGFRTGVVNKVASPIACAGALAVLGAPDGNIASSDPDENWNYEIGAKLRLADGRVSVNTAAYHIDWSDLQTQIGLFSLAGERTCQVSSILNVGDASIDGMELEVAALLTDALTADLAMSWTDGEYDDTVPAAGINAGDTIEQTPEFSSFLGLQYGFPLFDRAASVRAEWQYVGDQTLKGVNFVSQVQPAEMGDFHQLNLRASLAINNNVSLVLFADNLTDEYGVINVFDSGGLTVPTVQSIRPRTLGATVRYEF